MKIVEIKLPCGRLIKIELSRELEITEIQDKIFMLVEGRKIED